MKSITTDRTIDNNKQPDYDTAFDEIKNSRKFGKDKKVRVIPGFHLTLGITVTMLSLEIDALYMSGTDTSITSAFAVSSILVIIAIIVLVLRNIFEHRQSDYKKGGQK